MFCCLVRTVSCLHVGEELNQLLNTEIKSTTKHQEVKLSENCVLVITTKYKQQIILFWK